MLSLRALSVRNSVQLLTSRAVFGSGENPPDEKSCKVPRGLLLLAVHSNEHSHLRGGNSEMSVCAVSYPPLILFTSATVGDMRCRAHM